MRPSETKPVLVVLHQENSTPGRIGHYFQSRGVAMDVRRPRYGDPLPDTLADVSLDTKVDPWNRPYQYFNLRTAKGNGQARKDKKLAPLNSDFDLYSVGPDGLTAAQLNNSKSRDDVVRARDGGFLGTAEEFDP